MQVGEFDIREVVPPLRDPHLLMTLRPWTDVGSVGTLALNTLQENFKAQELGRFLRPGTFFDFTRYRPMVYSENGKRRIDVPNTVVYYARTKGPNDLLMVHALEPHMHGEGFIESLLDLMGRLGVRRYGSVGAMYGAGPHTRPLNLRGSGSEPELQEFLSTLTVRTSTYQGPTSIVSLVTEKARERGIGVLSLLVQLPPYARVDEDHRGQETLLRALDRIYKFGIDLNSIAQLGARQYSEFDRAVAQDPQAAAMVRQLEHVYDSQAAEETAPNAEATKLPPSVEKLLKDLEEGSGPR